MALPCLPPTYCFPTAPRASLVNQTYTCVKGGGDYSSPQPPVTSVGQVLHQHLGKTLGGLGGACLGLIFIYASEEVNK